MGFFITVVLNNVHLTIVSVQWAFEIWSLNVACCHSKKSFLVWGRSEPHTSGAWLTSVTFTSPCKKHFTFKSAQIFLFESNKFRPSSLKLVWLIVSETDFQLVNLIRVCMCVYYGALLTFWLPAVYEKWNSCLSLCMQSVRLLDDRLLSSQHILSSLSLDNHIKDVSRGCD